MRLFEGKTTTERNKIIAAGILAVVSLLALYMAFGRGSSSSSATVRVTAPTPKPGAPAVPVNRPAILLPTADEQTAIYESIPIVYTPGNAGAPDPGRNIFAFYEPPRPCRGDECPPTPLPPTPTPLPPPTPAPTPMILVTVVSPQTVYAGSKTFRLDVTGERFVPGANIYFNQKEIPTRFVTPTLLTAEVPAELIAREGRAQVIVQTKDGLSYSNQFIFNIQAPPKPTFQYIGMIGRTRNNNNTAYFTEAGRPLPYGARLNDVVGGRFRLIDMSPIEVVFEDVTLGFKHKVQITKAPTGTGAGQPFGQPIPGFPQPGRRPPTNANRPPDVDDNDDPGRP